MRSAAAVALALLAIPLAAGVKVVDAAGHAVAGAKVTILLEPKNAAAEVFGDEPLVHETDDRGALPFELPRVAGATVVVDHELHAPATFPLDGVTAPAFLTLEEGVTLEGRVSGDGRMPHGPGQVCAIRTVAVRRNGENFDVRRCAPVAADGSWTLRALPAADLRLEIGVPAHLPLSTTVSLSECGAAAVSAAGLPAPSGGPSGRCPTGAEPWSGRLEPGRRALLHVEDPAGRDAAGVTVECDGAVPAVTSAEGVAWVAVPGTSSRCRALAADGAESLSSNIDAPSNARQTLRLRRARAAVGTLMTNDATDLPPPRFTLLGRIEDRGLSSTRVEPVSLRAGAFRVRLPDDEPHALRIEAPGMLPLMTEWFTLPQGGGTADLGVLILRRGAGMRGRVVDASTQEPLAGAVVSLEAQGRARIVLGRLGKASAVTDSDGSFVVAGVPVGSYRMRVAWRELPPAESVVDLREESVVAAGTLALHPGVMLSGHVSRRDREPLTAGLVELIPFRLYDPEPVVSVGIAADGSFGPVAVAPGRYHLIVQGDGPLLDQEIDVPAGESFQIQARIRSTRLTGVVRDEGVPVSGGEVLLQRTSDLRGKLGVAVARNPRVDKQLWSGRSAAHFNATVNGAGVFTLGELPAGRMLLDYFGRSGERVTRAVDVADEAETSVAVDIDGRRIEGVVDDAETAAGLVATVELIAADGTSMFRGATRASGHFSVDRVAPGVYNVVASTEGYRTGDPVRVVVGNEAPSPVRVRLSRAGDAALDIVVRRGQDIPAAGVAVSIVDAAGRQLRAFPTMADGKLHVTRLPAGTVHLIWSDPLAGVGISPPIQLRPGPQEVTVRLEPGKDLIVRCEALDCAGASLGSISFTTARGIDLAPFLFRSGAIVYSAAGTAYLGRLAPGSYDVAASSGAFRLTKQLEVGSGPGEVELFLTKP